MVLNCLLSLAIARADSATDLSMAADAQAAEAQRLAAFERLVSLGRTNLNLVLVNQS